jgi:hypothetical protein
MTRPSFSDSWKKKAAALVKERKRAKEAEAKKKGAAGIPKNFPYSTEFQTGAVELVNQRKLELADDSQPIRRGAVTREEAESLVIKEVTKALEINNPKTLADWLKKSKRGQLHARKKGKGKSGDKYARQDCLLPILPNSSKDFNKQAEEAVLDELRREGYEISEKTLGRDIKALIHRGKLYPGDPDDIDDFDDDEDSTKNGNKKPSAHGWYKHHKPSLRFESLSVTDALSLSLLDSFLQPILPADTVQKIKPIFQQAKDKLKQEASGNKLARWMERVAVVQPTPPFLPPKLDDALLSELHPGKTKDEITQIKQISDKASDTIRNCLFEEQQVKVRYVNLKSELKWHTLNPLGLVQRNQVTYLLATSLTDRNDPPKILPFAMHRVIDAEKAYQEAKLPEGFSLQAHIAEGGMGFSQKGMEVRKIKLKAWFSKNLGTALAQTRFSEDQTIADTEDGVELTATVVDNMTLRWWLLSKTGDIVVLEPEDLREYIAKQLREGAARYD